MEQLFFLLTIFLVEQDFELVVELMFEHVIYPAYSLLVGQFPVHEGTSACLLHHLRPVVAGDLAEGLVTVDYGEVHDLGVRQQETAICYKPNEKDK